MIYLPPPQPIINKDIRISGDVEIHPTASLAPGVILQAAPDSRIVIGADVCIGMGAIINAYQGSIEIETGAILGSGVLIVGQSKIGNNCCIGTSTTIFQANVASMTVVQPGSIIGDISRQVPSPNEPESNNTGNQTKVKSGKSDQNNNAFSDNQHAPQKSAPTAEQDLNQSQNSASIPQVETSFESSVQKPKAPVVGQVYINELLVTLFPYNKNLNSDQQK
ncbi:MAG: carbon dioxide concentrating mechanism protein [Pleurocapsa sp.]